MCSHSRIGETKLYYRHYRPLLIIYRKSCFKRQDTSIFSIRLLIDAYELAIKDFKYIRMTDMEMISKSYIIELDRAEIQVFAEWKHIMYYYECRYGKDIKEILRFNF